MRLVPGSPWAVLAIVVSVQFVDAVWAVIAPPFPVRDTSAGGRRANTVTLAPVALTSGRLLVS